MRAMKNLYIKRALLIILFLSLCLTAQAKNGHKWPFSPEAPAKKGAYNLSESRIFPETLSYVQNNYVEPERINPKDMFKGAIDDLQKNIPEILVKFNSPNSFTIIIDKAQKDFSSSLNDLEALWKLMKEVFVFIQLNYKGDAELKDIEALAINGALKELDPHSALFTPEYYKEFKIDTGGEFGGLGIVITAKDGQLTVIAPIEDTPAWKAGIKSGDVITQIDNESTINMSLMKAVEKMRGKAGTKVALTIERKGKANPFELILTRAEIFIESVKSTLIKDTDGSVGYIRIKRFQKETTQDFFKQLKKLKADAGTSFKGLIIDLRDDPGGLLTQAVKIADAFLSSGVIVSTVGANGKFIDEDEARPKDTSSDNYPLIVLVNGGSASASEIVAGALQALGRALVIGEKTFGKGSVQSVYELENNYALKLTIAQYLTAGKYSIQTVGITPDVLTVPATVDKKFMNIVPNKPSSEKELEKHLTQISPFANKEKLALSYFKPYVDIENAEEMRRKEYSNQLEFKDDFDVKLATKMILAARSTGPEQIIKESSAAVDKLEKQEEEKISARLLELGTNWNRGQIKGPATFNVTSQIKQNKAMVERATAGENLELVLNVTNTGKEPLYQLIGAIESENPFLGEKEFVFGRIMPFESAVREVPIKLPASLSNQNIPFKVNFKEEGEPLNQKFSSTLKVSELKKPRFSFNYQLEKPRAANTPLPLPKGKSVPFTVRVKNIGNGPTKEAWAFIVNKKNEKNLFLEKGRIKLGVIKPGETKKADFAFKIQPDMESSSFALDLTVSDQELLKILNSDLEITVESGAISPQAGIWYEGPNIELAEKAFPIISKTDKYTLKGELTDDIAIKDYYVFVDEKKVVYRSNPGETNKVDLNDTIDLKEGNNNVTIIARDNNNLAAEKTFVIQKGNP